MVTKTAGLARSFEGAHGRIELSASDLEPLIAGELPWARGLGLARACRNYFGWGSSPTTDAALGETLGLVPTELSDRAQAPAKTIQLGLAIRDLDKGKDRFLFHAEQPYRRRFEAARFLGDSFLAHSNDRWLLGTRASTARQQAQRAFASELLAPVELLRDFLDGDPSDERVEEAGVYFGLTSVAIRRHVTLNTMADEAAVDYGLTSRYVGQHVGDLLVA
jgi:hypothetical protein